MASRFMTAIPSSTWRTGPKGKAARIVQQCPREFGHDYTSFEQAIELSGPDGSHAAQEKIIVLTLTQQTARRAEAELRAWFAPA